MGELYEWYHDWPPINKPPPFLTNFSKLLISSMVLPSSALTRYTLTYSRDSSPVGRKTSTENLSLLKKLKWHPTTISSFFLDAQVMAFSINNVMLSWTDSFSKYFALPIATIRPCQRKCKVFLLNKLLNIYFANVPKMPLLWQFAVMKKACLSSLQCLTKIW